MNKESKTTKQQCNKQNVNTRFVCTECGGDATVAMTGWRNSITGQNYYKKGERLCLSCHKKRTGISIF